MFFLSQIQTRYFHSIVMFVLVLLVFVLDFQVFAQISEIDSLRLEEVKASDEDKPNLYFLMSDYYKNSNLDSAAYYGNLGLQYAKSMNLDEYEIVIEQLVLLSSIYRRFGDYKKALEFIKSAEEICIINNDYKLLVQVKLASSDVFVGKSEYDYGIVAIKEALAIVDKHNLIDLKASVYERLSMLYMVVNDYTFANFFSQKAIELSKDDIDKSYYINCLLQHSEILFRQANYDSSYFYSNKALAIAKKNNLKQLMRISYRKVSMCLIEKQEFENALATIDSSIAFCNEYKLLAELTSLITYKAHIYSILGDFEKTLSFNLEALKLREQLRNTTMICVSYMNIGGNYTKLFKFDTAKLYIEKGVAMALEINHYEYLIYGYGKLVDLYETQGNYEKAFIYTKLKNEYKSLLLNKKINEDVSFVKVKYELEKEKAISEALTQEKYIYSIWFLVIISFVSIVAILFLIRAIIKSNKNSKEIKKLSVVIETTSHAVFITKADGRIIYVNNGFLKLTNFLNVNNVLGKLITDFTDTSGEHKFNNDIVPALSNIKHWQGEMAVKKQDGLYFVTEQSISVINSKDGNVLFYIGIFNDITRRKKNEYDLKTSKTKLETEVATRDKMFSVIAHDLTGPFSAILGFSKLMASDFASYQAADHKRFSQMIYESSKNTFDLLTNILNWSRSQLDSVDLFIEDIDLYELVLENINPLKLMIDKKGLLFVNSLNPNTIIFADRNTTGIIIRNLVSNAIKFTQRGGTIEILSHEVDNKINITVKDNGVGISSEIVSDLFNNDTNVSERGTEDEKGTGLGLTLCKEFANLNNGTISAISKLGVGSEFTVSLPLKNIDNYLTDSKKINEN